MPSDKLPTHDHGRPRHDVSSAVQQHKAELKKNLCSLYTDPVNACHSSESGIS